MRMQQPNCLGLDWLSAIRTTIFVHKLRGTLTVMYCQRTALVGTPGVRSEGGGGSVLWSVHEGESFYPAPAVQVQV
jgi:hypothetical protein